MTNWQSTTRDFVVLINISRSKQVESFLVSIRSRFDDHLVALKLKNRGRQRRNIESKLLSSVPLSSFSRSFELRSSAGPPRFTHSLLTLSSISRRMVQLSWYRKEFTTRKLGFNIMYVASISLSSLGTSSRSFRVPDADLMICRQFLSGTYCAFCVRLVEAGESPVLI